MSFPRPTLSQSGPVSYGRPVPEAALQPSLCAQFALRSALAPSRSSVCPQVRDCGLQ